MRRCTLLLTLLLYMPIAAFCQKRGYTDDFTSEQQIRNYYASNLSLLDPIEGEYDVQCHDEWITPFIHKQYPGPTFKWYIVCNNNDFTIYALEGNRFGKISYPRIYPIGETNAYRFYYESSQTRVYLQNPNYYTVSILLDHSSAMEYRNNPNLSPFVHITINYDCIKTYPTSSMYADAIKRKVEEESKPTLWTGTGFALTNNYVVTNYHVIEDAKNITIQGINGNFNNKYNATVVGTDKYNDLAILKVNGTTIASANIPYSVKTTTSEVGENVFVLGYPLTSTMGDEIKLTTGVISSKTGFQGDVSLYQISAPIQPGNSGGPLFDSKGNIIGIVSAKHRGAENVSYAIKTSYLRNLLESIMSPDVLPKTNKISALSLSSKVKNVKSFVYYIICSGKEVGGINMDYTGGNERPQSITVEQKRKNDTGKQNVNPPSSKKMSKKVLSVETTNTYTAVKIQYKNLWGVEWCNIDKNTYIVANGTHYALTRAEGITISPDKTNFTYNGQMLTFVLYFPVLPSNITTIDLIEPVNNGSKFYGISLK